MTLAPRSLEPRRFPSLNSLVDLHGWEFYFPACLVFFSETDLRTVL